MHDDDFDGDIPMDMDFTMDPVLMCGATLGLAFHAGLDMEECLTAFELATEPEFMEDCIDPFINFDTAVDAAAYLKNLVKRHYSAQSGDDAIAA